jgi:hypothetical protein
MDWQRKQPALASAALPRSRLTKDVVGLILFPEEGLWSQYEELNDLPYPIEVAAPSKNNRGRKMK